jgi:hypothetical protein
VAQRLTRGQVSLVTACGWGIVADFLIFLDQLEYSALLDLEGKGFQRVMIPIAQLFLTYQLKILLGIPSMNLLPTKLFREVGLLRLIGYTAKQMQVGFCRRGQLAKGPMHKNTLGDAMERLSAEEVEYVLNEAVKRLVAKGFMAKSQGHFALDATDLETTPEYVGAGRRKVSEWRVVRDKETGKRKAVEIERLVYGFKVLIVYEVRLRLVVAAKVVQIQQHESQYTLELLGQAIKNVGEGVIRVLLIDRGFLDGQDLWVIKRRLGIDFVVPSKDKMHITEDARGLCRREQDGESIFKQERAGQVKEVKEKGRQGKRKRVKEEGQVSVVGIAKLTSYDQYGDEDNVKQANRAGFEGNPLNAVVVTKWEGEEYKIGEEKVFLTTLGIEVPLNPLDLYDLRSLIENTGFRELKQGWFLQKYPKKTESAVRAHVFLTLVTFTLSNAFQSSLGQDLTKRGIRRQRAEDETSLVLVFTDDCYAFFNVEELLILLGVVPKHCLSANPEEVRRRYALPLIA